MGIWDLVKAAKDSFTLDLDDGVDHGLDSPHRGVVRLDESQHKYSVKYDLGKTCCFQ